MAKHECDHFNQFQEDCCVICKLGFRDDKAITVSRKGISIIEYSEKRGCSEVGTYLTECIRVAPIKTVLVHIKSAVEILLTKKEGWKEMLKKLRSLVQKDFLFHLIGKSTLLKLLCCFSKR